MLALLYSCLGRWGLELRFRRLNQRRSRLKLRLVGSLEAAFRDSILRSECMCLTVSVQVYQLYLTFITTDMKSLALFSSFLC